MLNADSVVIFLAFAYNWSSEYEYPREFVDSNIFFQTKEGRFFKY